MRVYRGNSVRFDRAIAIPLYVLFLQRTLRYVCNADASQAVNDTGSV